MQHDKIMIQEAQKVIQYAESICHITFTNDKRFRQVIARF